MDSSVSKRGRGRGRGGGAASKTPKTTRKRGRPPSVSPEKTTSTPITKAGKSAKRHATATTESAAGADLFAFGSDQEDAEAGWSPEEEGSDYDPEKDEANAKVGFRGAGAASIKRRSARLAASKIHDTATSSRMMDDYEDSSDDDDDADSIDGDDDEEPGDYENTFAENSDVNLFADPLNRDQHDSKDIYDFDAQSIVSGANMKVSRGNTSRSLARRKKGGMTSVPASQNSPWGSNIYSSLAAFMKNSKELEFYNAFVHSVHLNNGLDQALVRLCAPNPIFSSLFYGPGASLQSLLSRINNSDRIFSILSSIVTKSAEQLSHRIVYFVSVLQSSIFSLDYFPPLREVTENIDNQILMYYAFVLDTEVNMIGSKFDLFRHSDEVKSLVVADDVHAVLTDLVCSDRPSTCRLMVTLDVNDILTSFMILDTWDKTEIPFARTRIEVPDKLLADSIFNGIHMETAVQKKSLEDELREYLDEMITWVELQSGEPQSKAPRPKGTSTEKPNMQNLQLCDAFVVKSNGKKDILLLAVVKNDSLLVFNLIAEHKFMFARHALNKSTVITVEGSHMAYPDQFLEERQLLIVPDEIYRVLKENFESSQLQKMSKFAILDIAKRTPLCAAEEYEADLIVKLEPNASKELPDEAFFKSPVDSKTCQFEPASCDTYKLVVINGVLVGIKIDSQKVIRKVVEVQPFKTVMHAFGLGRVASLHPQRSTWSTCPAIQSTVKIQAERNAESVAFHGCVLTKYDSQLLYSLLSCFLDNVVDMVFDVPVLFSLYDIVFRLAQASTGLGATSVPECDPSQCCVFCIRELRTAQLNFTHELRHLDLPKRYRCREHAIDFVDQRSYKKHVEAEHGAQGAEEAEALGEAENALILLAGSKALKNRLDGPQCDKCQDFFPNMSALNQHLPACDGKSFSEKTPLPKRKNNSRNAAALNNRLYCGLCGRALSNRDNMRYHLNSVHNQCRCCSEQFNEFADLSQHYADHYNRILLVPDRELGKIIPCEECHEFYGTKHDYYFHQWSAHNVLHQPFEKYGQDDAREKRPYVRMVKDELSYVATGMKQMPCKLCQMEVRVMGSDYQRHLSTKHGLDIDANLICRICADLFDDPNKLSDHLAECHYPSGEFVNAGIQTIFRCDSCQFMGFQKNVLLHALEAHGDSAPLLFECLTCSERFPDRRLWRQHLEKHVEGYAYECQLCNQAFRARYALHMHMRNFHMEDDEGEVGPVNCEFCDSVLPDYQSFRAHILSDHPEIQNEAVHECTICLRNFPNAEELTRHETSMHSGACKCDICGKLFPNQRAHQKHRIKHFRTRMFQCTDCNATFKTKLAMKRHIRVDHLHIGPEKFECQICGKVVSQISMHMLTHKEARFECEFCGRRFTKACYYNEHVRIHKGERPFGCHICEMRFNKKSNLNVHLRMHEKHKDDKGNYLEIPARGRSSSSIHSKDPFAVRKMVISVAVGTKDFVDWSDFNARTKSCDTSDLLTYSPSDATTVPVDLPPPKRPLFAYKNGHFKQ